MAMLDEAAIFNAARILDQPEEREAYLTKACGDNRETYARVITLLAAYDAQRDFLESPPVEIGSASNSASISEGPGTVIGRYKLLEKIGEGGFAVVYMAEQTEPIRRQVALKIIKLGMDTRQVIARFEAERQALAMMDHPGIAKVYDAGATETGRPYFVMQLIRGVPITEYCDQCSLSTRDRLELLISVCHAVQHAHEKGIIHRDIKPTNVLVALRDGRPEPKVIDFGIAKATNQKLSEHTVVTAFAQMIGTPVYMSPEQAELSPLGVDNRSDIYSLGVLLYELLTSTTPIEQERIREASYDEVRCLICKEDAPRPSNRISTLSNALASTIAERRRVDVARLSRILRGDLDTIVMKCLEKERFRRYQSASELAAEIQRFLTGDPIQASPVGPLARTWRWCRKNPTIACMAALLVLVTSLAIAGANWEWQRPSTAGPKIREVGSLMKGTSEELSVDRTWWYLTAMYQSIDDIAGVAIDAGDDTIVTWHIDSSFCMGRSYHLDKIMKCHQYTLPQGADPSDIVGISIAADHRVYVWFRNGTWSTGNSEKLDHYAVLQPFELPDGKSTNDIVEMAISKTSDEVYTWYHDGTVSVGDHRDLDRYKSPYPYRLPHGKRASDIVGIDFTTAGTVVAWFRH